MQTTAVNRKQHILKSWKGPLHKNEVKNADFRLFVVWVLNDKIFCEWNDYDSWTEQGSDNCNSSSKGVITNSKTLLGVHENMR